MAELRLVQRYRRRKKVRVFGYNPWLAEAEPGDLMVTTGGKLMRLEVSSGRNKRDAGDLTPRTIKPPRPGLIAVYGPKDEVPEKRSIWWAEKAK